jgi:hypothetical protein
VAALQVHDLRGVGQDSREEAMLDGVQRGPGRSLREQVVILAACLCEAISQARLFASVTASMPSCSPRAMPSIGNY